MGGGTTENRTAKAGRGPECNRRSGTRGAADHSGTDTSRCSLAGQRNAWDVSKAQRHDMVRTVELLQDIVGCML